MTLILLNPLKNKVVIIYL